MIIKHRLRANERSEFVAARNVATKLIIPINENDLKFGAHYVFVGQKNFEQMLSGSIDKDVSELRRDLETLRALDAIPTLDPFLLREQLQRNGITPAGCYFQITDADVQRMLFFAEKIVSQRVV